MRSIEIFSGCGGLALGLSRAGFTHDLMVEWDDHAVATIEHNRQRKIQHVRHWPHDRLDYQVNGVRVYCNPRGYPRERLKMQKEGSCQFRVDELVEV